MRNDINDETRMRMQALAQVDPDFKVMHDFFVRCISLSKEQFLVHCRSDMPHVAEVIANKVGSSPLTTALKQAPLKSDQEVVDLTKALLQQIIKTVESL